MAQKELEPWAVTFENLVPVEWRHVLDSSPALVAITIGPRHLLAYQNPNSQAWFGTRARGRPLHEVFDLPESLVEPLTRALETRRAVEVGPRRVEVRDQIGADILMRYVLAPLGEPPQGVVITALDVTAEVRAEQALARTQLLAEIDATARASVAVAELRAARQRRDLALEVYRAITHLSELLERLGGGENLGRFAAQLGVETTRHEPTTTDEEIRTHDATATHELRDDDRGGAAPADRIAGGAVSGLASRNDGGEGLHSVGTGESLVRSFAGVGALTVAGEVDVSNEEILRSALLEACSAARDASLVVDLTRLEWIDVAGARSLLTGTAAYRSGGGVVELVGVQDQVHRLLDLIGVNRADGVRVDLR